MNVISEMQRHHEAKLSCLPSVCPSCRPPAGLRGPKTHQHVEAEPDRAAQDDHAVGGEWRFSNSGLWFFRVAVPLLERVVPSRAARHHADGASVQHERVQRPAAALRLLSNL